MININNFESVKLKSDMIKNRKAKSLFIMFMVLTAHTVLLTKWLKSEDANSSGLESHNIFHNQIENLPISPAANIEIDSTHFKLNKLENHLVEMR